MNIKTEKCPICGGFDLKKDINCTDNFVTGESFDIYICGKCNFKMTQNVPSEDEIGRYYEATEYISHSDTKKGIMNNVYHKVRNYMLDRKANIVISASKHKKGTLLDIGTGTGYFANEMTKRGWDVEAIEKSKQARDYAFSQFGLNIKDDSTFNDLTSDRFDVVTLWHVMEHLEHINETWDKLHDILKSDGTLIVAVPNCSSYDAIKYGSSWAAYDVPRHLWHFTPTTMTQIASKHGFNCIKRIPMPFDAFYVSMLTEKYKNSKLYFIRAMLTGSLAWINSLFNKNKSSSIIYILKKSPNKKG